MTFPGDLGAPLDRAHRGWIIPPGTGRILAMREIECNVAKIIINEQQDGQVIWLQEKNGPRAFAVVVGFFEASSLRDRVRDFRPPRPMTHNLIGNCIAGLGGKLLRIVVNELKNNTYYARLVVMHNGDTIEIDSRPSDALVLAMQEKVPIFVADEVLTEAGKWSLAPQLDFSVEDLENSFGDDFPQQNEDDEDDLDDEDDENDSF